MNIGKERAHMNLARIKKHGKTFEIVVDPDQALAFKKGELADVRDALNSEQVFTDAQKGLVASTEEVTNILDVPDLLAAAARIIKEGDLQLTGEIRDGIREQKIRAVIHEVHRFGVDPRTNAPHPIARIEAAFEQAKVKVDQSKTAQEQLTDVLRALNPILPLKVSVKTIQVIVPSAHAGKCLGKLKQFGVVKKQQWQPDGSLIAEVEMPGGLEADFYDEINRLTSGQAEAKVL